ncbi:MAG: hypothetical protein FWE92_04770, partial [Defluviitaleaceae bacterium]|nr:hypothetical protein [Defluviitaleaceae bacterium]
EPGMQEPRISEPKYTAPPRYESPKPEYILPRPIYSESMPRGFVYPKVVKPKYVPPAETYSEDAPQRPPRPKAARPEYAPPRVAYWDGIDRQAERDKEAAKLEELASPKAIEADEAVQSTIVAPPLPKDIPVETMPVDTLPPVEDEFAEEPQEDEEEGFFEGLKTWVRTKLLRRVQQVAGLALFVAACYWFTGYVGGVYAEANDRNHVNLWSQQRFEDFYALPDGWLDMVFLGSSHSFTTFDPNQFEGRFNAFQLGMPLQTPDSSFFTLLEVYNYQRPGIVVMELYWNVMRNDFEAGQIDTFFRVLRSEELRKRYIEEVLPLNERVMYELEAIRHQAAAFAFANAWLRNFVRDSELFYEEGFVEDLPQGIEYYRSLGYVYSNLVMTQTEFNRLYRTPARRLNFTIAPRQRHFLEEMVRLTEYHGSQLIFVTAPISNVSFANILDYDDIHREISGFAEYHGIPYLDFHLRNIELGLFDDDMFRDHGHLNHRGAMVAGEYFMQWLEEVLR